MKTPEIERKALIAEINKFIEEAMKMHLVECWTETYKTDPFSYVIDGENNIIWLKAQARQLWEFWQAAKAKNLEGYVVVPLENVRYFSNDGENYEVHQTIEDAKSKAECAIEYYSERLADQLLDPRSDGNFQQISYGVVLAESSYSIDHIVTQKDKDNGDYSYEVGTEIMSLFLVEAAWKGNEDE